jgi:hypothetical protein
MAWLVTWCDLNDPYGTLERFLNFIRARFPAGVQVEMY